MARICDDGTTMAWHYDQSGSMIGFTLNGVPFFYLRNLQGDVVAIHDASGNVVARYAYDAWGNLLYYSGPLARINPITYRGYYFDWETGLFYLETRYYNPQLRRFISADIYMDTGQGVRGTNMYMYCLNDPINWIDPEGTSAIFVVNFRGAGGLAVVGHSLLLLQDAHGDWWFTEFTGTSKANARVNTGRVDRDILARVTAPVNATFTQGSLAVYIPGDFTRSLKLAQMYDAGKLNVGRYVFYGNNCNHYALRILFAGTFADNAVMRALMGKNPITNTPIATYFALFQNRNVAQNQRQLVFALLEMGKYVGRW